MRLSHPLVSIIPSLTGYVLEVLAGTNRPLSGREVQRLLPRDASHRGTQLVLDSLAEQGVVIQQETGSTILNSLNPDHILSSSIHQLASVRTQIVPSIGAVVQDEAPSLRRALLFGSLARGEADDQSDVDLLLVWPDDTLEATRIESGAAIERRIKSLLGNECRALHYSSTEFDNLDQTAADLAKAVDEDSIDLLHQVE